MFFAPLSEEHFVEIADLMLQKLVNPLKEKGIAFSWTPDAALALAHQAHGGKRGARDLRNVIRREVEDRVADLLVSRYDAPPTKIVVSADENGQVKLDS